MHATLLFQIFYITYSKDKPCIRSYNSTLTHKPAQTCLLHQMDKEILIDLPPFIKIYTDGTVYRDPPHMLPDFTTNVSFKDTTHPNPPARLYLPNKLTTTPTQKLPILIYFHGGGFCLGSAFEPLEHRYMNILSAHANALIISVDYRLAPEHPLPAAYDDAWSALNWVCSHSPHDQQNNQIIEKDAWITKHGDFTKIFICGDSAGGNIAHNVLMRAGSEGLPGKMNIRGAILSFPYFWGSDPVGKEPREGKEEHLLTRLWVEIAYPNCEGGIDNPMINPVGDGAPSLSGLGCGKLMVCLGEKDLVTGRAIEYVKRVKRSGWGGEVELVEVEDEDHCFHYLDPETEKAKGLIKRIASFISPSLI